MKKYALISVYDKKNINIICEYFFKKNISIISTGSTALKIKKSGYPCLLVSDLIKFKEILDGRVKTLHPNIHASLLFSRDSKIHQREFNKMNFPIIDFVIVNLYPFSEVIKKNLNYQECLDMIDIGGPTLLRSAAKNYKYVTAICDVADYKKFIHNLKSNNGLTSLIFRKKMASKVFHTTYKYDKIIAEWFNNKNNLNKFEIFNHDKETLKYGENPHQKSYFYKENNKNNFFDNIISGNKISYNNLLDIDVAFSCVNEFIMPTCVIIKHNSPCGIASNKNISYAFTNAKNTDPISAFGGIIAFNKKIDEKTAKLISKDFYEIILAPSFSYKAKLTLEKKQNLRLINTKGLKKNLKNEIKSINKGFLVQEINKIIFKKNLLQLVSKYKGSTKILDDLVFAFKVSKYVKSNAIVLVKNQKTVSISGGQTSRIDATKIAVKKINKKNISFVAASDAFFPFIDNLQILISKGCKAIIQPKGSINDNKIIKFANKKKLPLYFSKFRFFKH